MSNSNLQKHTLNLRRGDWDFLESVYKPHGVGTSEVVRALVRDFVDKKRRESGANETLPTLDNQL